MALSAVIHYFSSIAYSTKGGGVMKHVRIIACAALALFLLHSRPAAAERQGGLAGGPGAKEMEDSSLQLAVTYYALYSDMGSSPITNLLTEFSHEVAITALAQAETLMMVFKSVLPVLMRDSDPNFGKIVEASNKYKQIFTEVVEAYPAAGHVYSPMEELMDAYIARAGGSMSVAEFREFYDGFAERWKTMAANK